METNKLTSTKFDREADYFRNIMFPQFQIRLLLVCPEGKMINNSTQLQLSPTTLDYVAINGIEYSPEVTIISIMVDDINDHAPKFELPSSLKIGYPSAELADKILPDNLIQIHVGHMATAKCLIIAVNGCK